MAAAGLPDQARLAISKLSATWHQPSLIVDVPRLHLQTPSVALEAVMAAQVARVGAHESRTPSAATREGLGCMLGESW